MPEIACSLVNLPKRYGLCTGEAEGGVVKRDSSRAAFFSSLSVAGGLLVLSFLSIVSDSESNFKSISRALKFNVIKV